MTTITNTVDPALLAMQNGTAATKSTVADTQNQFLNLLVTQMKNQDPLNPMDNAQVTSQLAQLSTVTGINQLNAAVATLSTNMIAGQNLQAANMIGHGVIAPGSAISLSSGKSIYGIDLVQGADKVDVTIKNAAGATVKTISLGSTASGLNQLTWDGSTDAGGVAADGQYTFSVAATSAGKAVDATALSFGLVSSVTSNAQGVKLSVANIGDINMADIRKIY